MEVCRVIDRVAARVGLLAGLALLVGCSSGGSTGAPVAGPSPSPTSMPAASPYVTSAGPPASSPPPGSVASPRSTDPDNPTDLVGPPLTLTGTIVSAGRCVIIETDQRQRWLLTGSLAKPLVGGATVTVRGRAPRVPPDCAADRALFVQTVSG